MWSIAGALLFDKVRTTFQFPWVMTEELFRMLAPKIQVPLFITRSLSLSGASTGNDGVSVQSYLLGGEL